MSTEPSRTAVSTAVAGEGKSSLPSGSVTFEQMQRLAVSIAKSGLFGLRDADQALALMAIAQAEGKHPAIIARDYHIITTDQGSRPAKKADAMLRDFQAAGGKVEWHKLDDTIADATFSHPQGGSIRISWDMKRAEQAGLVGRKGDMYKKYARAMFRARVVSEGVRTIWPSATSGMYTPQEAEDIVPELDVTPNRLDDAVTATAGPNALSEEDRDAHFNSIGGAPDLEKLKGAFSAAWKHASEAKDHAAGAAFKQVYESRKTELGVVI